MINGIVLSAICMLMGMVYGPYSAMKRRWPMLSLLQGVSVPGEFMERVDIVWATVAAVALFMGLGVLLSHCRQAFCTMLGVKEILQPLRYKGLLSFGILVIVVSITGYKGVQAQDRLYVSTFFADVDKQGYVFYFSGQNPEDAIYAVHAKDIKAAVENYTLHEQKQPNFGHIEATVLSDKLLMDRQATKDLFRALAAWQDFAENSYVYRCDAPKKLFTADTGDTVPGVYLAGLYDDHPERKGEKTVLRQLLSAWLNGRYTERIPRILVDDSGQITVSTAADS